MSSKESDLLNLWVKLSVWLDNHGDKPENKIAAGFIREEIQPHLSDQLKRPFKGRFKVFHKSDDKPKKVGAKSKVAPELDELIWAVAKEFSETKARKVFSIGKSRLCTAITNINNSERIMKFDEGGKNAWAKLILIESEDLIADKFPDAVELSTIAKSRWGGLA